MWYYIFFISLLMLFFSSIYEWLSSLYILAGAFLLFCLGFVKMFFDNLDRKYYYNKKYLWNFYLGMFLLLIFTIGSILDVLGYIEFITYFAFLWPISFTFYFYGLKTLLWLKLVDDQTNEGLLKRYKVIEETMKIFYFGDVLVIFLYIFLIWDKRI